VDCGKTGDRGQQRAAALCAVRGKEGRTGKHGVHEVGAPTLHFLSPEHSLDCHTVPTTLLLH
jgi:hypothetical protein